MKYKIEFKPRALKDCNQEELEDYEDLKALREVKAKEADAETILFEDVKKMFGIS